MSGFLGRETLMPSSAKRGKRGRTSPQKVPTPAPDFDADSESSSSEEDRPPAKKMKTPTKKISSSSSSSSSASNSSSSSKEESGEEEEKDAIKTEPGSVGNWSVEDLEHLTSVVLTSLPPHDTFSYTKRLERMNWDQIKFGVYSADDCKKQWVHMYTKVRTHRTMAELALDVKSLVMNNQANFEFRGKNNRVIHPDMPKKPQTAYFKFIAAKREHFKKKHPGISHIELTKVLAKRYNEMSDLKKKKYLDAYTNEMKEYKVAYEKFKAEHPELFITKSKNNFARPMSAMQIFINRRMEENLLEHPQANRKELQEELRKKWAKMNAARKDKYIKKSIEDKIRLERDLDEYCKAHPDFDGSTVRKRYDRTKVEKEMLDKASGKPAPPPRNVYHYFQSVHLSEHMAGKTPKEHMATIATKWKNITSVEKNKYISLYNEKVKQYENDYAVWKESLSPEDRKKAEAEEAAHAPTLKNAKKELVPPASFSAQTTITQTLQRKPISAMFVYIEEKKEKYKKKHPKLSNSEVTKVLSKKFQELSDEKKQKYKKLEIEQKKQLTKLKENGVPANQGRASPAPVSKKPKAAKRKLLPGEPKKPPGSGYLLFSCELLQGKQLAGVPSVERMAIISQKWKALSVAERDKYKTKKDKMVAKYKKDLERFCSSLSPEDRAKFEESLPQKSKSKKKASAKPVQKPSEESDESSSSGSSSSGGSDSSSASESESEDETPKVKSPSKVASSASESESEDEAPKVKSPSKVARPKAKQLTRESASSSSSDEESEMKSVFTPKVNAKKVAISSYSDDSDSDSSLASGPKKAGINSAVNLKLSSAESDSD